MTQHQGSVWNAWAVLSWQNNFILWLYISVVDLYHYLVCLHQIWCDFSPIWRSKVVIIEKNWILKLLQNFTYEVFKSRFEKVHLRLICYRNSPKLMKYFNKFGRWLILWNQSRQNDQLHVFWGVFWKIFLKFIEMKWILYHFLSVVCWL